ncbi:MAG: 3-deoxy-7-phosphoheptulonate synthase [Candidatus Marinimicrobia bacterium]|nr:3-deoxy-7-phosphoheptulonate synthase [Candidatus Neomarinimicrobiota bacterium]MBL7022429.1 3-deoxy-7-phosphoheptulonate synthase [Candidatus Neomarinimicrobiota bacterium]MBL7109470.1 3-deoxy-7-phosphoheptulonate synthase [Candidatus Neomarinimicrobiota bacterium]
MKKKWQPNSWKNYSALQQPEWPNKNELSRNLTEIEKAPPLVFAGEVRKLKEKLACASQGKCFILQGGDCAETFADSSAPSVREKYKILLQMNTILAYEIPKDVLLIGRIAGQFAKPRTSQTETHNGVTLQSYRGDSINDIKFTKEARTPDPKRLVQAYHQSASTLNLLRAFTMGGFADLNKIHIWNKEFITSVLSESHHHLTTRIDEILASIKNNEQEVLSKTITDFYTSHEALILDYEQALTRRDSLTNDWVDCSAHTLWIGDRTRQPNGAHVEFLSGVINPIGIKIGPTFDVDDLPLLINKLNPQNEPGKIALVLRLGAEQIGEKLPPIIQKVQKEGYQISWMSDPMHGNTYTTPSGYKTRSFDTILTELKQFFEIHRTEGTTPAGIHFEFTGENVTECLGGTQMIEPSNLDECYETACDPRLNNVQSLELAFAVADLLKK